MTRAICQFITQHGHCREEATEQVEGHDGIMRGFCAPHARIARGDQP